MDRMPKMERQELTEKIIGCAMKVHSMLGPGFLESVYQRALAHELGKAGLKVECERPITVHYDGIVVGDFSADMLVEGRVILELKANQALVPAHEVQLVNYLTATGIEIGLLLNFGAERLEFKRKARTYRPKPLPKEIIL
jgi:GxxExxY protein